MKRLATKVLLGAAVFGGALFLVQQNQAWAITGVCNSCHTMHNSQNGTNMGTTTANNYLLMNNCLGCHQQDAGGQGLQNSVPAPIVYHTEEPNTIPGKGAGLNHLAGGDFYWVDLGANDKMGHNVDFLPNAGIDNNVAGNYDPPGYDGAQVWGASSQLSCGGTYGCHVGAGAHHVNVGGVFKEPTTHPHNEGVWVTGAGPGSSYRFLDSSDGGAGTGYVKGFEDNNYEYTVADDDHNIYWGKNESTGAETDTMTALCARCHGIFHGRTNTRPTGATTWDSPWIRHPTDYRLSAAVANNAEYGNYNTYDWIAPVAADTATSNYISAGTKDRVAAVDPDVAGEDNVTCVSCHRAHGSPFADLLRWSYGLMNASPAGSTANQPDYTGFVANSGRLGCFACHSTK